MVYKRLYAFVALSCMGLVWSQGGQEDPIKYFCRRWSHSTARIDSRLYIDGGMVGDMPFNSNYSNDYLLFSDLDSPGTEGMPSQSNNLTKPKNIPSVSGGYIWADNTNKCFYQFGGEYVGEPPTDFSMWTYDVLLDQWNTTSTSGDKSLRRVSFGAGTQVEDRGLGFYFGGWLSNKTTTDWEGPPMATSGLVRFDFTTGDLKNITGPDALGRAEGHLTYLPVSDGGVLLYFGGIEDSYHNGNFTPANMTKIHVYDLASSKWYTQTTSGNAPPARRQFCADVTWPNDRSAYNIYMYGGYGFKEDAFDDVYVLTLPSFKWVKAFPEGSSSESRVGHGGCTANVIERNQIIVMGGWFPRYDQCDVPDSQGQHNMVLGYNGAGQKLWDKFDRKLSAYVVPSPIISAIGGGPTGGATVTAPLTWDHPDLAVYYTIRPSFPVRSATRLIASTAIPVAGRGKKKTSVATIAGATVGGSVALILVLAFALFCLHRRKKASKTEKTDKSPTAPLPVELAVTTFPQEMSTSTSDKYTAMHERSPYPGAVQPDLLQTQQGQQPPSYGITSPSTNTPVVSPITYAQHGSQNQYDSGRFNQLQGAIHDVSPTRDQQGLQQPSCQTPTSPASSFDLPIQQQPPTNYLPAAGYRSQELNPTTDKRYSGDTTYHRSSRSLNTTPTQFYARPALQAQSRSQPGETPNSTRRPIQGRFMEDEHM